MSKSAVRNSNSIAWFVVVIAGLVVLAVVSGLDLSTRLDAGQRVLDGARPAFAEDRVEGNGPAIAMIGSVADMLDPIVDVEGGAAGEVGPLVGLVAGATGLPETDVLAAIEANFPHTYHLLLTLPLDHVSAEIPALLTFVAENSGLADADAVLAVIAENTPNIAQAVTNLLVVTENWRDVDGTEGVTRFDGVATVDSVPELSDFFAVDVLPAVEAVAPDFHDLDEPWPKVSWIATILNIIGIVVVAFGLLMVVATRSNAYSPGVHTLGWSVVTVVGVVVAGGVLALGLFPRLDSGQQAIDDLKPAFVEERVAGMEAGVGIVDNIALMADPIADAQGGAGGEVGTLVGLVAGATGLPEADVLAALEANFPHTFHLLLALPLDQVSAEIPELLTFVADNSGLADGDAVLAAIADTTPQLAQAITNLIVVTDGFRAIPGTETLTRFDGTPARSIPEIRDYFHQDVVPAVRAVADDYRTLETTAPPVDHFPPLLLIVGILVIIYGVAMVNLTSATTESKPADS
jgi:predicted nucleic acid-binding protein